MDLVKQFEKIQKRPSSKFQPGSIDRIFEIYERSRKDASGYVPIFIKPTPEEKKQKRSLN